MSWKESSNKPASLVKLTKVSTSLSTKNDSLSPIDCFYKECKQLILIANQTNLNTYNNIGQLVILGVVSATENYFRDLFSGIIDICNTSKTNCLTKQVQFGAAEWYKPHTLSRSLFDHVSFSNADQIKTISNNYCEIAISKATGFDDYLNEFEKVCELRHCIAHASGYVVGKNAVLLGVSNQSKSQLHNVSIELIHECIAICQNLVQTYNKIAFEAIMTRWASKWPTKPTWIWTLDRESFNTAFLLFQSKEDKSNNKIQGYTNPYHCYMSIRKDYY